MNSTRNNAKTEGKRSSQAPFYAWNCLSIQLAKRTIDLVVPDEKAMFNLLKILVYKMNTLDGVRGSSLTLQRAVFRLECKKLPQYRNREKIYRETKEQIKEEVRTMVFRKAMLKYRILAIRSKISYQAYFKKVTIVELFLT